MITTRATLFLATLILVIVGPLRTSADTGAVIVVETTSFISSTANGTARIYLAGRQVRIDSNEGSGNTTVIYRAEKDKEPVFIVIDRSAGTYIELTKRDMLERKSFFERTKKDLEDKLKDLAPEQRKQMEQLHQHEQTHLGPARTPTVYRMVAEGIPVGKWKCTQYEGTRDDEKREEVWAAPMSELGLTKSDVEILNELGDLFADTGQDAPAFFHFGRQESGEQKQFPVLVLSYNEGKRVEKSEVKDVRREKIDPQLFVVPEGLRRRTINVPGR